MKRIILTATGTNIGKTYNLLQLIKYLKQKNKKIHVLKPIISGYSEKNNDVDMISEAINLPHNQICRYFLQQPLSPNIAANLEGVNIDYQEILRFINSFKEYDYLLIETAGGLFSPINNEKLVCDLLKDIPNCFKILITGDYLGTISHTISAVRACEVKFDAILMNSLQANKITSHIHTSLENLLKCKVYKDISEIMSLEPLMY